MIFDTTKLSRKAFAAAMLGSVFALLGALNGCDNTLVALTSYFDPCGTILDCAPGYFQSQATGIGDPCFDPLCTVPGGCENANPPLGTQFNLCP